MRLNDHLRQKYTHFQEPEKKKGVAGFNNVTQFGRAKAGNQNKKRNKHGTHVVGMTGRTLGKMSTAFVVDLKKKR